MKFKTMLLFIIKNILTVLLEKCFHKGNKASTRLFKEIDTKLELANFK